MTGPEHYYEAEQLINAHRAETDMDMRRLRLSEAQVHATLALAAATARQPTRTDADTCGWYETAGQGEQ